MNFVRGRGRLPEETERVMAMFLGGFCYGVSFVGGGLRGSAKVSLQEVRALA